MELLIRMNLIWTIDLDHVMKGFLSGMTDVGLLLNGYSPGATEKQILVKKS